MLIENITTELKDTNGSIRATFDVKIVDGEINISKIHSIFFAIGLSSYFNSIDLVHDNCWHLQLKLRAWVAEQTIKALQP